MELNKFSFVAIDVETANPNQSSICQIGIAKYVAGELVDEWSSLVDPEDFFSHINVSIHGITKECVSGSPVFSDVVDTLRMYMSDSISVSHGHFDKIAISKALSRYCLPEIKTTWLDSAKVARRAWKDFSSYGLHDICRKIDHEFAHHDALEDAKAAAQVILAAGSKAGLDIES